MKYGIVSKYFLHFIYNNIKNRTPIETYNKLKIKYQKIFYANFAIILKYIEKIMSFWGHPVFDVTISKYPLIYSSVRIYSHSL